MQMLYDYDVKTGASKWEGPCDPRLLWLPYRLDAEATSKRELNAWFPRKATRQLEERSAIPSTVSTFLTPAQVRARAVAIMRTAQAARDRIAEEEAGVGLSLE
jgi:hypothetical protein